MLLTKRMFSWMTINIFKTSSIYRSRLHYLSSNRRKGIVTISSIVATCTKDASVQLFTIAIGLGSIILPILCRSLSVWWYCTLFMHIFFFWWNTLLHAFGLLSFCRAHLSFYPPVTHIFSNLSLKVLQAGKIGLLSNLANIHGIHSFLILSNKIKSVVHLNLDLHFPLLDCNSPLMVFQSTLLKFLSFDLLQRFVHFPFYI